MSGIIKVIIVALWAFDRPIEATRIVIKRSASGTKSLTFIAKDPNALFLVLGRPTIQWREPPVGSWSTSSAGAKARPPSSSE